MTVSRNSPGLDLQYFLVARYSSAFILHFGAFSGVHPLYSPQSVRCAFSCVTDTAISRCYYSLSVSLVFLLFSFYLLHFCCLKDLLRKLTSCERPFALYLRCSRLHDADTTDFIVPRTRTKFGERALCVSGPTIWNSLPESLRTITCTATFKRHLKTHFLTFFIPAVNLLFIFILY